MKKLYAALLSALIGVTLVTSCADEKRTPGVDITEFPVKEVILTADRTYRVTVEEGDTVYLDQYASIHWPIEMGGCDITPLCDSLVVYCFGDSVIGGEDAKLQGEDRARLAIERFVLDTSVMQGEGVTVTAVDSLPGPDAEGMEPMCYFNNVTATVMEVDELKTTFKVTASSYLGGAHPVSAVRPFTYDLAQGRVLTVGNMFTPEGVDSIMPVIVSALARQLDVRVDRLDRAGIFTSQLTYPGQPYIYNNVLYFHYNPYDIAPYSSGMIDVAVYPYEVERWFRPGVAELFDFGI